MFRPASCALVLLCSMIAAGCSDPSGATCTRDDECASGFCRADGTCAPAETDAAVGGDATPDGPGALCVPDHDGAVTRAELPLAAGKMATFRIATGATFATAGDAAGGGLRTWDLSTQLATDTDTTLVLSSPAGTWWQASFSTATYATTLAAGSDLLGVFRVDAVEVVLLGVVSPAAGALRTELAYDPPARILALPIAADAMWSTTSTVSGVAQGLIVAYTEGYASRVDATGTMTTPYGAFPVLRVATDLTRTSGLATLLTRRSFAWVAECFGTVATVSSQDFEAAAEFDDPAEVRRLAP